MKHHGKTFREIYETDRSYCVWAINNFKDSHNKSARLFRYYCITKFSLQNTIVDGRLQSYRYSRHYLSDDSDSSDSDSEDDHDNNFLHVTCRYKVTLAVEYIRKKL